MLKVFATETLAKILRDTFQLHGGLAYFTDQPFERMVRDGMINTIGEGANDVLRAFTALVGMRDVGLELQSIRDAIYAPLGNVTRLSRFAGRKLGSLLVSPSVPVRNSELEADAADLGRLVNLLGNSVQRLLVTYQLGIVDRQYQLGRVSDAATEVYTSACVLNRLDHLLRNSHDHNGSLRMDIETGRYYLRTARRRIKQALASLWDNDDEAATSLANRMLRT
jgi:hypothetical protein